jgi:hypothetical protein
MSENYKQITKKHIVAVKIQPKFFIYKEELKLILDKDADILEKY